MKFPPIWGLGGQIQVAGQFARARMVLYYNQGAYFTFAATPC
jgi:hypothetical protein